MLNQYKVTISNNKLYKEIDLPIEAATYSIGTTVDSDYRLRRDFFFSDIKLVFMNDGGNWSMMCSDNIYISLDDARKMLNVRLNHGDGIDVRYQDSDNTVFRLEFGVDFDSRIKDFERKIDISNKKSVFIGTGKNNNIIIKSEYLFNDAIELVKEGKEYSIIIRNLSYGLYVNGNRINSNCTISNGNFFAISDFTFFLKDDALWTEATDACRVNGLNYRDFPIKNDYPVFHRNTRINMVVDETEIEILDPPAKPTKPKNNLLMAILPSMGMLLAAGVMASMGGAMIIFSLISSGMAIVTAIVGMVQSKKDYKRDSSERIEKYDNYIKKKRAEIEDARENERNTLNEIYAGKDEEYKRIDDFSSDLFDRSCDDTDFLAVRVGIGEVEAKRKINYKKQEKLEIEDNLQEIPEVICNEYKMVESAPVVCELKEVNAIGVIGKEDYRYELLKTFVIDLATRHFYSDVKLFFVFEDEHSDFIYNIRFLPHIENNDINTRNIVCDDESKKAIFEYLFNILSQRERSENKEKDKKTWEHFVLFFYDLYGFNSHPVSRFVEKAKELNVTFIFFGDNQRDIPLGCDEIINILDGENAELIKTENELSKCVFSYEKVDDIKIKKMSKILAPIQTDEVSLEGSLTKNINLFELLNIFGVEDLDLKERWSNTEVYKSISVPLGVSKTGIVYLDLHDKAHGPHGLVAGTTGSGKSEILQTFILSIATYFHPYEVAFLIIDFKGGGMVNQFRDLPHLLGAITNIDGKEIDRSLKSIKAELQKRQRLFAEADVNHIDLYIKKYKSGASIEPLPHLIIIVDEFAELKAEQPDFMKELISTARIGRSLGVHLILATQKPAGQVDDQIWSNSRFKLCLKVQGPEDSNEVLKSPLAAEIKEPGRAYLQVGNNEIFELFQSAYSGASEKDVDNAVKPFKISYVDITGKRSIIFEEKPIKDSKIGRTQLEAIVDKVNLYCKDNSISKLSDICMKSLDKRIEYVDSGKIQNGFIDIGIYDDPENQYQGSTCLDITNKNTFIIGSSQYGKTNILQLMIREIAEKNKVEEANIYILDFASMVLKNFEKLKHVGGVVCSSEDEKFNNLMKLLMEEIVLRRERMIEVGVSSFSAYCEAGYTDLPHIYLFIDNFTALQELYLQDDDSLLGIIREGLATGISCVVANAQVSGISFKYISNFANKISLYCNDSNEYSYLFERPQIKPDDIVGRAIVELDKRILECQTYLSFVGEKEIDRTKEINELIAVINSSNFKYAKMIPFIPSVLEKDVFTRNYLIGSSTGYRIPIGLSYDEVAPVYIDLSNKGSFGICGKEGRGHYNFINYILTYLENIQSEYPASVVIFDDVNQRLKKLSELSIVKSYYLEVEKVKEVINSWNILLADRYDALYNDRNVNSELLLLVINNNDVAKCIADDYDTMDNYRDMVSKYRALNVSIIFSNYPNKSISYDAPEPIQTIRSERQLIYFDELDNLKVMDVPYEIVRSNRKKPQVGDAFIIDDNEVTKVKIVKSQST
ncbi:DNA segregation ATPase FtsK/SpoIIIE, S-DNA-T family [Lachnospiraceae bacterium NE2001]|nr:DNA segregation ATPase FtsK/SpoIIIE, S-DNA-T family [Lachnospiraceae bacterium NE2001]